MLGSYEYPANNVLKAKHDLCKVPGCQNKSLGDVPCNLCYYSGRRYLICAQHGSPNRQRYKPLSVGEKEKEDERTLVQWLATLGGKRRKICLECFCAVCEVCKSAFSKHLFYITSCIYATM